MKAVNRAAPEPWSKVNSSHFAVDLVLKLLFFTDEIQENLYQLAPMVPSSSLCYVSLSGFLLYVVA